MGALVRLKRIRIKDEGVMVRLQHLNDGKRVIARTKMKHIMVRNRIKSKRVVIKDEGVSLKSTRLMVRLQHLNDGKRVMVRLQHLNDGKRVVVRLELKSGSVAIALSTIKT